MPDGDLRSLPRSRSSNTRRGHLTLTLDLDLGWDHIISGLDLDGKTRLSCRLLGINAPELSTQAGKDALAYIQTLVKPGDRCTAISYGWDKYGGRWDGRITLLDGRDLGQLMLDSGHAVPFPA